ncbi:MAG: ankyrin repeat domain-containing protein [Bdellovibrionales bacterium]|nr:ankyrin repeat domain-containing protein [Bdellovibrionales bacterium]
MKLKKCSWFLFFLLESSSFAQAQEGIKIEGPNVQSISYCMSWSEQDPIKSQWCFTFFSRLQSSSDFIFAEEDHSNIKNISDPILLNEIFNQAIEHNHENVASKIFDTYQELWKDSNDTHKKLFLAIRYGRINIVQKILQTQDVDCNTLNIDGLSFLHVAIKENQVSSFYLLVRYGATTEVLNKERESLGSYAAKLGNISILKYLLKGGLSPNDQDYFESTLLHYAAKNSQIDTVKFLLNAGADPNFKDKSGRTPLHVSIFRENIDLIRALVEGGAEINISDEDGWISLHLSLLYGNEEISRYLIEKGTSLDFKDVHHRTALHLACRVGYVNVVRDLIRKNVPLNEVDLDQKTPLDVAISSGYQKIIDLLKEEGAESFYEKSK